MCYRQLMSVAEAVEIIDDLNLVWVDDQVKGVNPHQLVAVPLAVLYLMAKNAAAHASFGVSTLKTSMVLRAAVMGTNQQYPLPAVQHVPPPMPEDFQLHKDMELANKILEQDYDIFKELAKS